MYANFSNLTLIGCCVVGFVILLAGGHALVKGAQSLSISMKISPLIIGLTIVATGTSLPEIFTAIYSSIINKPDFIMGDVLGSNIVNICLGLGLPALLRPIKVHAQFIRRDMPFLLITTLLYSAFAYTGMFTLWHGVTLVLGAVVFLWFLQHSPAIDDTIDDPHKAHHLIKSWAAGIFVVAGLALLWLGAKGVVDSAVEIAKRFNISESFIGFVLIGGGTSLPEIVTSGIASYRKQFGLCVGNIVGSNIVNILIAGGSAACISPVVVSHHYWFWEIPINLILTLILWRILFTGRLISRKEGAFLLGLYGVIIALIAR